MQSHKPIIICGPTASGKSALAVRLAQKIDAVIINADSQQVYKEIPILSAQPSEEEKRLVPHYLFGEITGNEEFNVSIWLEKVLKLLEKHPNAIIVGGTGMYINALLHGLSDIPDIPAEIRDKVRALTKEELIEQLGHQADGNTNRMRRNLEVKLATGKYIGEFHTGNSAQAKDFNILNMNVSRETLYGNINHRFLQMIDSGAVEEVQNLLKLKYNPALPVMKAVGVSEIAAYLESQSRQPGASAGVSERELTRSETINNVSRETMIQKAQQRSRNYAKRQMTWFRHQLPKHKIDVASFEEAINLIK